MPVNETNLDELIHAAWSDALNSSQDIDVESDQGAINSERSQAWMNSLGKQFESQYSAKDHRVFWTGNKDNKSDFGLKEMLFDMVVCRISRVTSLGNREQLPFVAKCYWQVESEFNRDNSRKIVEDMRKLVMGSSENKLFVASHKSAGREWENRVLTMCSKIAKCCDGKLFFCFIAHPADWGKSSELSPSIYRWIDGDWERLPFDGISTGPFRSTLKKAWQM